MWSARSFYLFLSLCHVSNSTIWFLGALFFSFIKYKPLAQAPRRHNANPSTYIHNHIYRQAITLLQMLAKWWPPTVFPKWSNETDFRCLVGWACMSSFSLCTLDYINIYSFNSFSSISCQGLSYINHIFHSHSSITWLSDVYDVMQFSSKFIKNTSFHFVATLLFQS